MYRIFLILFLVSSCKEPSVKIDMTPQGKKYFPPFDTAAIIKDFIPYETVDETAAFAKEKNDSLDSKIETVTVQLGPAPAGFWVDILHYNDIFFPKEATRDYTPSDTHPLVISSSDTVSSTDLLDNKGYYIEAASKNLELPEAFHFYFNRVKLTGRFYKEKRKSITNDKTDFPEGRVFRYYKYELVKSYSIRLPLLFNKEKTIGKDTVYDQPQLTMWK